MPEPLPEALAALRERLLDQDQLVRAVAAGRRRGLRPSLARAELRPVNLREGRRMQVVTTPLAVADPTQLSVAPAPITQNLDPDSAAATIDALLAEPFGNWHVETTRETLQLRVTKRGEAQVHRGEPSPAAERASGELAHDRVARHLLAPDDPLFSAIGADQAKRRQVDAFLRQLAPVVTRVAQARPPTADHPLRVVDLGCGNAYLTLAAYQYLNQRFPNAVRVLGVDVRRDVVTRNRKLAEKLSATGVDFVAAAITDAATAAEMVTAADIEALRGADVVLALHACDTATDDALAVAVRAKAAAVLAAPCCHHDLQRQLGTQSVPATHAGIARHPILRERFADVLTDALRADILRLMGYRVSVVEFIDSRHTPRNAMIRAERAGASPTPDQYAELTDLMGQWGVRPRLWDLLSDHAAGPVQSVTGPTESLEQS